MAPPPKNNIAVANFGSTVDAGALARIDSMTSAAAPLSRIRKASARAANRFRSLSTKIGSSRGSTRLAFGGILVIIPPLAAAL